MKNLPTNFRPGSNSDANWLFQLFRHTLKEHIDQAWGWDEQFQQESFSVTLPAKGFVIAEVNSKRIGGYYLLQRVDYFDLQMILVEPAYQNQGYGRQMIENMTRLAGNRNLPIKLRVLKSNPSLEIYQHLGFKQYALNETSIKMIWESRATVCDK